MQKVAVSREFEARLRHAATGKLSLSTQQKVGTFFELGKDKAAKGQGWAPPFISCAQDTVRPPLRLLGYGKPLPLPFNTQGCLIGGNTVKRKTTLISVLRLGYENMHISLRRRYGITSARNLYNA